MAAGAAGPGGQHAGVLGEAVIRRVGDAGALEKGSDPEGWRRKSAGTSRRGRRREAAGRNGQKVSEKKEFPGELLVMEGSEAAGPRREEAGCEPLTPEQEEQLMEHLPMVRYLARRIHERLPHHVELDDLVSAGMLGLLDAIRKFDRRKKVQFRSYAQFRIRGAILDSLRTLDWGPRDLRRKGRAVEEAMRAVTARLGRAPQEAEVAAEMRLSLGEYQHLLGDLKGLEIGTLHAERSEDSGEEELAFVATNPEDDPLFQCLQGELRERLIQSIEALPERERLVMTLYYYEEMTMKEIGLTLGVVESRVSQMHSSAVLHLRSMLGAPAGGKRTPARAAGRTQRTKGIAQTAQH